VLLGTFVLISIGYLVDNLLIFTDQGRKMLVVSVIALIVNVVGNFFAVHRWGFMGAAWVALGTMVVVTGFNLWFVRGAVEFTKLAHGRLARIVLSAGLLCVALWALDDNHASLAVLVVAAVVVYPTLLLGLRALRPDDVLVLVRRRSPAG
jgi:O-antigen/teichoic acid export membrane protein